MNCDHNPELTDVRDSKCVAELLAALDRGHNVETIGRLRREELYDRD